MPVAVGNSGRDCDLSPKHGVLFDTLQVTCFIFFCSMHLLSLSMLSAVTVAREIRPVRIHARLPRSDLTVTSTHSGNSDMNHYGSGCALGT